MTERYAAQAVTSASYGQPEIVIQALGPKPNDWPTGEPLAALPIPGEDANPAALDAQLRIAGYRRVTGWEPADFGSIATVVRDEDRS